MLPCSATRLPRIKICGVTRVEDLHVLAQAGVDSVGFNFVDHSSRSIDVKQATPLCAVAHELGLIRVAVVMNMEHLELAELLARVDVDFVQLHGNESPKILSACNGVDVIKAISWSGRDEEQQLAGAWKSYWDSASTDEAVANSSSSFRAFLVDAYSPREGGGTGRVARWDLLYPRPSQLESIPLILAGGLTAQNVQNAIEATRSDGVDTASGVEESPGIKSSAKVASFASNANTALGS